MLITRFVELTRSMRAAQKNYFKSRAQGDLVKAKQLEAEVDKALADGITTRWTVSFGKSETMPAEEYSDTFDLPRYPDEPGAADVFTDIDA